MCRTNSPPRSSENSSTLLPRCCATAVVATECAPIAGCAMRSSRTLAPGAAATSTTALLNEPAPASAQVSAIDASAPSSATMSTRGCEAVSGDDASTTWMCAPSDAPLCAWMSVTSCMSAVFSAVNASCSKEAMLPNRAAATSAASEGAACRLPTYPPSRALGACATKPSTTLTRTSPSAIGATCGASEPGAVAGSGLARAIGPTSVYFQNSLPRRATGKPSTRNRAAASLRSAASHGGAPGWAPMRSARARYRASCVSVAVTI